ncbi:MAG: hypothetical protein J7L61_01945, partial [Thermoplasmata archaeon]|nr:hypothetical protein [Thermoplasmata archaeon]
PSPPPSPPPAGSSPRLGRTGRRIAPGSPGCRLGRILRGLLGILLISLLRIRWLLGIALGGIPALDRGILPASTGITDPLDTPLPHRCRALRCHLIASGRLSIPVPIFNLWALPLSHLFSRLYLLLMALSISGGIMVSMDL